MKNSLLLVLLIFYSLASIANEGEKMNSHFAEAAPEIDGILDDKVWQEAQRVTGFKSFAPDYEKDMAYKTVAYWSHDADNLYFAFKCFDDPSLIKTSVAARDKIRDDDWVCVNLDSFNDRQTLYGFYVNPNGIQMDSRFAGGRDDAGIDMVWYSAGHIDEDGYTIELKIPFKSIRYAVKDGEVDMGVIFERKISRFSSQGTYPALDPNQGANFLTQTMPVHYNGVNKTILFEAIPAVTYGWSKWHEEGQYVTDSKPDVGLTLKYGITSDLILDATLNPDFSQVESDVQQVEINQRFPLYYPERRPFFLEGNENFNHAGGSGRSEIRSIVNTRSIINPIFAAKLTGKIGLKNTISTIAAVDEVDAPYKGKIAVMRYKRTLKKDSYIGGFFTGRQDGSFSNIVYGGDGQIRLGTSSMISGFVFNSGNMDSLTRGTTNRLAMASNFAFNTRSISYGAGYTNIDDGFSTTVGYVTRTGITKYNVYVSPKFYPKGWIKRVDPLLYFSLTNDKPSGLYERSLFSRTSITLDRNSRISLTGSIANEIYEGLKFNRGSISLSASSQITKRIYIRGEYRRQNRAYYSELEQGDGQSINGNLNLQLSDNFNSEWNYSYSDLYNKETGTKYYDVHIIRSKNTYQLNKYLFLRVIVQYNSLSTAISPDFLASFTYIPGTVVHLGYGSVFQKTIWDASIGDAGEYVNSRDYLETAGGFFFKASYLFRYKGFKK
jgi:hypothetical protein